MDEALPSGREKTRSLKDAAPNMNPMKIWSPNRGFTLLFSHPLFEYRGGAQNSGKSFVIIGILTFLARF